MKIMSKHILMLLMALPMSQVLSAQNEDNKFKFSGSIQSDILLPQEDTKTGAKDYSEWALTNTFVEMNLRNKTLEIGARLEYLEHPMPGYEKDYAGWGVPNFYLKGNFKRFEFTAGTFYEQFGSGFILRTYEDRALGIDNSLLGGKIVVRPFDGVTLKLVSGKQRRYWDWNDSWINGADVEFNLDQWIKPLKESNTYLALGLSGVTKHEEQTEMRADPTHIYNFPENTAAWDARLNLQKGGLSILAEYAQKSHDPNQQNDYIYRKGYVAMLSTSYSQKGLSLLLQAKRSDNMGFRSRRSLPTMTENSSYINHLPAFTQDHTYTLASHYVYATNPDGEWAYQAALGYNFKRNTLFGGKYGTKVKANFSYVRSINKNIHDESTHSGYGSAFWKWGAERYYQDFNVQVEKKLSKNFQFNLMYMNQFYNQGVVEAHGGMVHSDIYIAEAKYRFNKKFTLRAEAQYLTTGEDQGDWAFGLLELSFLPNFMFTVSDEWNCGETDLHYYNASVTGNFGAHRIQVGYARTRAGLNCSGGVCRPVPAMKGVNISYNYNF